MKELTLTLISGKELRLVADYKQYLYHEFANDDGFEFDMGISVCEKGILTAYIDGEYFGKHELSASMSISWGLFDMSEEDAKKTGCPYYIRCFKIAFTEENAKKYDEWLKEVTEDGRDEETKEYYRLKKEKDKAEEIQNAKSCVERVKTYLENNGRLMTEKEYKTWARNYNNAVNEGGEGYIPLLPTQEAYDRSKKILEENSVSITYPI